MEEKTSFHTILDIRDGRLGFTAGRSLTIDLVPSTDTVVVLHSNKHSAHYMEGPTTPIHFYLLSRSQAPISDTRIGIAHAQMWCHALIVPHD